MMRCVTSKKGLAVVPIVLIGTLIAIGLFPVATAQSLPPVADAGPDQTVYLGDFIILNGTASTDDVGIVKYTWAFVIIGALATLVAFVYLLVNGYLGFVSEATREKSRLLVKRSIEVTKQVMKNKMGAVGIIILVFFGLLAILGPTFAPYKIDATAEGPFPRLEMRLSA